MGDDRERTLARSLETLRETLRVAEHVYATAVELGFTELTRFEAEAIAKLEDTIPRLEDSGARRRGRPAARAGEEGERGRRHLDGHHIS